MKNHLLILVCTTLFICCSNIDKAHITFSGKIINNNAEVVKVTNYNSTLKVEIPIDSLGNFSGPVLVEKDGYYFFQIGRSYTTVRFKKGEDVFVTIDADSFYKTLEYSGDLKKENNYNVSKARKRSSFIGDAKEYFVVPLNQFLPKIARTRDSLFNLLEKSDLGQKDMEIERSIIEYEYLQTYNNYQKFYSYHQKVKASLPDDYYDPVLNMDIDNDEMFRHSRAYRNLIIENFRHSSKRELALDSTLTIIDFVKNKISNIKSIDIREQYASMLIRQMKESNPNLDDDYKRIMKLLLTERMKEKLTQRHKTAKESTSGAQAVNFNYENFNGGRTTLKDLSGKLLYIDVWATWCGPCIKEMPALKELIAHYAGKEIEFVSISIDHESDYKKWRKMVPEKNIGGIHLYDNEGLNSAFMKAFSVGLIPRFMMIDREGKIITAHAPRPSDKGVKDFIDKQLSGPKVIKFTSN